jgi:hypothetical protein
MTRLSGVEKMLHKIQECKINLRLITRSVAYISIFGSTTEITWSTACLQQMLGIQIVSSLSLCRPMEEMSLSTIYALIAPGVKVIPLSGLWL